MKPDRQTCKCSPAQGPLAGNLRQVGAEAVFLCLAAAAVAVFGQDTPVMSVLIAGIISIRFWLVGRRGDWIFFLVGLIAGGGNDVVSMARDVYRYTPPHLLPVPIPIWMLFLWGLIFTAFRHLFRLPAFAGTPIAGRPWRIDRRLALDAATFIALRIVIYGFVRQEPVPTVAYAAIFALRLALLPPKKNEWRLAAAVMATGPLYEAALIRFGLYIYYDPVFLGMPAWLLIYWAFAIPLFMKNIFDRIEAGLAVKGALDN